MNNIFSQGCFNICRNACDFTEEPEVWISSDEKQIQSILDYCEAKEQALGEGKDLRIAGGDLTYSNNTHYIDSNICSWVIKNDQKIRFETWQKNMGIDGDGT